MNIALAKVIQKFRLTHDIVATHKGNGSVERPHIGQLATSLDETAFAILAVDGQVTVGEYIYTAQRRLPTIYRTYRIYRVGDATRTCVGEAQYPNNSENCFFYDRAMWTPEGGFQMGMVEAEGHVAVPEGLNP